MTSDCGALAEAVAFLRHFKGLEDPRQKAKVNCPREDILLLCLLAVLAGHTGTSEGQPGIAAPGRRTVRGGAEGARVQGQ